MSSKKQKMSSNTCRCCLSTGAVEPIFNKSTNIEDVDVSFSEMISACSSYTVSSSDGLPHNICLKCLSELTSAYNFRLKCDKTYNTLKLLTTSDIKESKLLLSDPKLLLDDNIYLLEVENDANVDFDDFLKDEKDIKVECDENTMDMHFEEYGEMKNEDYYAYERKLDNDKDAKNDLGRVNGRIKIKLLKQSPKKIKIKKLPKIKVCPVCDITFKRKTELRKHLKTHPEYVSDKYFCEMCQKYYKNEINHKYYHRMKPDKLECDQCGSVCHTKVSFINHLKIHSEDRNYVCKECGMSFKQPAALYKHKTIHEEKKFFCKYCSKKFTLKYNLTVHMRLHTDERPYSCPVCKETFRTGNVRNNHLDTHQDLTELDKDTLGTFLELKLAASARRMTSKRLNLMCTYCGKQFKRKLDLNDHVNRHLGIKAYYCEICKKHCTSERRHKYMHAHGEQVVCEVCSKQFTSRASLKTHMAVHSSERPFLCACGASFKQAGSLKTHRLTHGEKLFVCHVCSNSFTTKYKMIIHVRTHTKERPFQCDQCPLKFTTGNQLNTHKQRHSNVKSLPCTLCEKSFKTKTDLRQHLKVHDKVRRYPCKLCDKRFYRSDHRNRHELIVHSMETIKKESRDDT